MDKVWAVLVDGPCAGQVCEVNVADFRLEVTPLRDGRTGAGTHSYQRVGYYNGRGHYIARFAFAGTLVI